MHCTLERALQEMRSATSGLTDEDLLHLRLAPDKWTAAEILEHLTLALTSTTKLMQKISSGSVAISSPALKQRLRRFIVIKLGYMPRGSQAPEFTRPRGGSLDNVRERFQIALNEMDEALNAAQQQHPTARNIAAHKLFGPLSLREWQEFHLLHIRHHMAQIRAIQNVRKSAMSAG